MLDRTVFCDITWYNVGSHYVRMIHKIFRWPLLALPGVDEFQTRNSNKLRCCFHHNCCISGPLSCHLSELGDPLIDWDEKMWEGRQACLLQEFGSKSSKPDIWLLFVAVFLHRVCVSRDTADRMSVSMVVSLDRWLDTRPLSEISKQLLNIHVADQ